MLMFSKSKMNSLPPHQSHNNQDFLSIMIHHKIYKLCLGVKSHYNTITIINSNSNSYSNTIFLLRPKKQHPSSAMSKENLVSKAVPPPLTITTAGTRLHLQHPMASTVLQDGNHVRHRDPHWQIIQAHDLPLLDGVQPTLHHPHLLDPMDIVATATIDNIIRKKTTVGGLLAKKTAVEGDLQQQVILQLHCSWDNTMMNLFHQYLPCQNIIQSKRH
jgi:hypothetical protein